MIFCCGDCFTSLIRVYLAQLREVIISKRKRFTGICVVIFALFFETLMSKIHNLLKNQEIAQLKDIAQKKSTQNCKRALCLVADTEVPLFKDHFWHFWHRQFFLLLETPQNFVITPLGLRPKTMTTGNSTFFITSGNSNLFLFNPWKFLLHFFQYPWEFHILNLLFVLFLEQPNEGML